MKQVSDTEIRTKVRSIVARYRIDLQKLQLRIAGGTVRVGGELEILGGGLVALSTMVVEAFERDMLLVRGVHQLYFDLRNWRRLGPGEWSAAQPKRKREPLSIGGSQVGSHLPAAGAV